MTQLSVVMITRNQEWNVPRLVESVLAETVTFPDSEVVLVDSASTDRTVELASDYPVTIIRLSPDQRLTAAMGRYVGAIYTSGEYILFLDGDMELGQGWLRRALDVAASRPGIAVLTGHVIDRPVDTSYDGALVPAPHAAAEVTLSPLPYTGGAALYRRSALEQVGSFRPYVYSDEEPELCIRIRQCGHEIARLDYPIAYHYSTPSDAMSTLLARWRRNLYLGAGQNLRYNLGCNTFLPYVRQRGYGLVPALALLAGLVALVWYRRTGKWRGIALWGSLLLTTFAADTYRKKSLHRAMHTLLLRLLIMDGTFRGFVLPPLNVNDVPVRVEFIRPSSH